MIAAMVVPGIDLNVLREQEKQYGEFKKIGRAVEEFTRLETTCDYMNAKRNLYCYNLAITKTSKAIEAMKATIAADARNINGIVERRLPTLKDIERISMRIFNDLPAVLNGAKPPNQAPPPMLELLKSEYRIRIDSS